MSEQPEALRLSIDLEGIMPVYVESNKKLRDAAAELRRLHEVNQELVDALTQAIAWIDGDRTPIDALTHARAVISKARGEG